ncbi:TolB-like 6-bladed beta-propeller domain-containing protein [Aquiflexum sp. LQ15W]|uniref:BF3164 family lipoprotein n=1 Tax=Cognataquiflexum nitidum TaxID=2922272 RepID=UPI001F148992|nr:BF3164 family lipoprotein [Cognataquiflexum nitidum]MCH6200307.1 TolB-like 6-bladed beta-propeller domain-containing protein [Cognataquiflexum nitidum]
MHNQIISLFRLLPLLIYTCSLFFGCAEKDVERHVFSLDDLPEPSKLNGTKHLYDELLIPYKIHYTGNYLIVAESKKVENDKIHILDPSNKKYLSSKGIDGLGPGEITQVQQIENISENDEFWIYDFEQILFSKFDISDSSKLASEQVSPRRSTIFMTEATLASTNSIFGNGVDGWTKYIEMSFGGDTLAFFGNWKDVLVDRPLPNGHKAENFDANLVSNIHQGVLKGNLEKRMFVKAGMQVDYFEIIDLDNRSSKIFFGPLDQFPEFTITYSMGYQMPGFNFDDMKLYYRDVYVGKDSFFLLYIGKLDGKLDDLSIPDRIFEFDFEGKPINHFILSNFNLSSFTVDEVARKFYGISEDDNPNVVEFDY